MSLLCKKITRQKKSHSNNISKFKENDAIKKSNFRTCMTICEEEKTFLKRVEESQDFFPVLLQWHGEKRPN